MSDLDQLPTFQAYTELQAAYDYFNSALFDSSLPLCLITLQREKRTYGYFSAKRFVHQFDKNITDEIAINPSYFAIIPVMEVLQTICHEMVHLWQHHHGTPGRRAYHNKEWAAKMESIGLMPSSTGQPGGAKTGEKIADYPIPGGRFLQVANQLLDDGFRISWLDRYPPKITLPTASLDADSSPENEALDPPSVEDQELASLIEPQEAKNRSNRVKYRCDVCNAQVWGKPNIAILCGGEGCKHSPFLPVQQP